MYRTLKNILIALFIIPMISCNQEPSHEASLLHAEKVMEQHPDSALFIISSIKTGSITTEADSALYALLLTQAQLKNNIQPDNSTLISFAANYYKHHPHKHRYMLALLYLGQIQMSESEYDNAITTLLKAEDIAIELNDWFHLGLIYRNISFTYNGVFSNIKALAYSQKSVEAFKKSGNVEYWNYERCNLADAYYNVDDIVTAQSLLDSVITTAILSNDSVTVIEAIHMRAYVNMKKSNWQGVIDDLSMAAQSGQIFDTTNDQQCKVVAYLNLGQIEKADSVFRLLDNEPGQIYVSLHNYYAEKGYFTKAYQALKKQQSGMNVTFKAIALQNVSEASDIYKQLKHEEQSLIVKNHRLVLIIILTICIAIILCLYIIHRYKKKILTGRISLLVKKYELLSLDLYRLASTTSKRNNPTQVPSWKILFKKQFSTIDKLCSEYSRNLSLKKSNQLAKTIEDKILGLKDNEDFIGGIFNDIDLYNSNLIHDLKSISPNLTDNDFTLLALLCSGLSNTAISIILSIDIDPLYVRKSRLKSKISKLDFNRKEELLNLI